MASNGSEESELLMQIENELRERHAGSTTAQARLYYLTARLHQAVQTPEQYAQRTMFHSIQHLCLLIAIHTGLVEKLADVNTHQSVTAGELAAKTGHDEDLIARTMRLLVAMGFSTEIDASCYRANKALIALNDSGHKGTLQYFNQVILPVSANIRHSLPKSGSPQMQSFVESALGTSFWDLIGSNEGIRKNFEASMAGLHHIPKMEWFEKVPVKHILDEGIAAKSARSDRAMVVDVGGGDGKDLVKLMKAYPSLQGLFVVQDLPETISGIGAPLEKIECMQHDFFRPQPIHGARVYFMRHICHDWPDANARKILSNVAQVMERNFSRLLIYDLILPETMVGFDEAGFDIIMMTLFNGKERTMRQWKALLSSVNPPLQVAQVWHENGEDGEPIIEAELL